MGNYPVSDLRDDLDCLRGTDAAKHLLGHLVAQVPVVAAEEHLVSTRLLVGHGSRLEAATLVLENPDCALAGGILAPRRMALTRLQALVLYQLDGHFKPPPWFSSG